PASAGLEREEQGGQGDGEHRDDPHRPQRRCTEERERPRVHVGDERRLAVGGLLVELSAISDDVGLRGEERLVRVEHVDAEGGGPQHGGEREQHEEEPERGPSRRRPLVGPCPLRLRERSRERYDVGAHRGCSGRPADGLPIVPVAGPSPDAAQTGASSSPRYRRRHRDRCGLPDDVFGSVPGRTKTTSSGGTPTASVTRAATAARMPSPMSSFVSATTTTASRPRPPSVPKAITLPGPTPSTDAAARSTSSGNTLRPPTMITSFSRPHTTSSPSTM